MIQRVAQESESVVEVSWEVCPRMLLKTKYLPTVAVTLPPLEPTFFGKKPPGIYGGADLYHHNDQKDSAKSLTHFVSCRSFSSSLFCFYAP